MTSGLRLGLKKSDRNYILQKKNAERQNNKRSSKADQEKVGTDRWIPASSSVIYLQVHNTGKIHWLASSSIGGHPVSVCDSLYDFTESTDKQLAQCNYNTLQASYTLKWLQSRSRMDPPIVVYSLLQMRLK